MQGIGWPAEAPDPMQPHSGPALPEELQRAARGEAVLAEALLTLAHYQEELACTAAGLLERETWALTVILTRSEPIWKHLPNPTLRFMLGHPDEPHLEVGSFSHLAALMAPTVDEQALIAATTPCWARVFPADQRRAAGQTGPFACSYVAISVAEAVATLGFGRILGKIEVATRTAVQAMLAQAQAEREREARILSVEQMLGWGLNPADVRLDRTKTARTRLVLLLLGQDDRVQTAVLLGLLMFVLAGLLLYIF